jgi:hypothetical protein
MARWPASRSTTCCLQGSVLINARPMSAIKGRARIVATLGSFADIAGGRSNAAMPFILLRQSRSERPIHLRGRCLDRKPTSFAEGCFVAFLTG